MSDTTPETPKNGSPNINIVMLMGRLTKDPQFYPAREDGVEDDKDRCWAVIAHNPPTKNKNVEPVYMPINCFGRSARILAEFGKKGKGWGVEGALKTRTTDEADGSKKNYTEIMVRLHHMGNEAKNSTPVEAPQEQAPAAPAEPQEQTVDPMVAYAKKLVDMGVSAEDVETLVAKKQEKSGDAPF